MQLTRQEEQDEPVHNQNRPEHRDVEDLEPAADEPDDDRSGRGVPELELGESSDKRPELLVLLGRQVSNCAILHLIIQSLIRRVELWLQEGQEEVE